MPPLPALQVRVPNSANALLQAENILGARQQRNALVQQEQRRAQIGNLLSGDLTDPTVRQQVQAKSFAIDPTAGAQIQQMFQGMNEEERAQTERDARLLARTFFGTQTQEEYTSRRNTLPEHLQGGLSEVFVPEATQAMVAAAIPLADQFARETAQLPTPPLSPAAQQQRIDQINAQAAAAAANRAPPTTPASLLPRTEERQKQEEALRAAGAANTNVTVEAAKQLYGNAPTGFSWVRNQDGSVQLQQATDAQGNPLTNPDGTPTLAPRLVATPGGPAQAASEAEAATAARREETRQEQAKVVLREIQGVRDILNDPDNILPTSGLGGQLLQGVGGTAAFDLNARLETVRANIGFNKLQEMRAASPTGGALGQVSNFENRLLQSVLGSLVMGQSREQMLEQLANIEATFNAVVDPLNHALPPGVMEGVDTFDLPHPSTIEQYNLLDPGTLFVDPGTNEVIRKPLER